MFLAMGLFFIRRYCDPNGWIPSREEHADGLKEFIHGVGDDVSFVGIEGDNETNS